MGDNPVSALQELSVENIFVYVGDAVRWDYLPTSVATKGLTTKTVASSVHSPTSFASLLTGVHPYRHGVNTFGEHIPTNLPLMFDIAGFDGQFWNSIEGTPTMADPIFPTLGLEPPNSLSDVDDLSSPFIVIERGPGGHAPYGSFEGSVRDYFRSRGRSSISQIREEYSEKLRRDAAQFNRRLRGLEDAGHLADTLVVYTSDHGELLGDRGMFGHNAPMHPKLVYVPTVFIAENLSEKTVKEGVFRHVDLLPTVLSAVGVDITDKFDHAEGWNVADTGLARHGPSFYRNRFGAESAILSGKLHYEGLWEPCGGHCFALTSLSKRLQTWIETVTTGVQRHQVRRMLWKSIAAYIESAATYGNPSLSAGDAKRILDKFEEREVTNRYALSTEAQERLKQLGYHGR